MIKSRSAYTMPSSRPRRIWLNGVGSQNGEGREDELKKSLPYCDAETGTKNRVVERDPIAGLGLLGKEYDPFLETRQTVTPRSARDKDERNPLLGQGNLGQEVNLFNRPDGFKTSRKSRNPLESGEKEADILRPSGRPGKVSIRQAQRDPISGRGEFGREWDPVYKYAGRSRPWHQRAADAKRGGRCNPVTGEDAKSFDINQELKRTPRKSEKKYNPVTGENCDSYTVSDKMNEKRIKAGGRKTPRGGNPLTGENCASYDFNVESRPATASAGASPRKPPGGNPVTGENCTVYAYGSEFKPKASKPNGEAKNPLTGANCQSYTVCKEERPKTAPSALATPRPVSNPVTGEGCRHYVVCNGEKKTRTAASANGEGGASTSPRKEPSGNPVTGCNVRCFDINQELRTNRRFNEAPKPVANGHCNGSSAKTNGIEVAASIASARSNPITGM